MNWRTAHKRKLRNARQVVAIRRVLRLHAAMVRGMRAVCNAFYERERELFMAEAPGWQPLAARYRELHVSDVSERAAPIIAQPTELLS